MHGVSPYPLYWPLEYARCASRRAARFQVDFVTARSALMEELRLLGARDVVVSSNLPIRRDGLPTVPDKEPADPGVAVYFARLLDGRTKPYVLACDQYAKVRWNLRAVQATLEALRTIERCGATSMMERAFSGFAQLPPKFDERPWREVLGISLGPCTAEKLKTRYIELAKEYHTGAGGGDHARMVELNAAYERARGEVGP